MDLEGSSEKVQVCSNVDFEFALCCVIVIGTPKACRFAAGTISLRLMLLMTIMVNLLMSVTITVTDTATGSVVAETVLMQTVKVRYLLTEHKVQQTKFKSWMCY